MQIVSFCFTAQNFSLFFSSINCVPHLFGLQFSYVMPPFSCFPKTRDRVACWGHSIFRGSYVILAMLVLIWRSVFMQLELPLSSVLGFLVAGMSIFVSVLCLGVFFFGPCTDTLSLFAHLCEFVCTSLDTIFLGFLLFTTSFLNFLSPSLVYWLSPYILACSVALFGHAAEVLQ